MKAWYVLDCSSKKYERRVFWFHWLGVLCVLWMAFDVLLFAAQEQPFSMLAAYALMSINVCLVVENYNNYRRCKITKLLRQWSVANYAA